jgi:hypothetical protein
LANVIVEDSLPVTQVLQPTFLFINTHPTEDVVLTIVRGVDLGVSVDPEDDGIFETEVVSAVTILAGGGEFTYEPPINLVQGSDTPLVQHVLELSHASVTDTVIVQLIVSGIAEVSTRANLLNFTRAP